MSFSQWTAFNNGDGAGSGASIQSSTIIEGSSSLKLRMHTVSVGPTGINAGVGLTSGANVTSGKVRSIFQWPGGSAGLVQGLFCMMQSSIATGSNCYFVGLQVNGTTTFTLYKGQINNSPTTLGTGTFGTSISAGNNFAWELKWQYDSVGSQMFLTVSTCIAAVSAPSSYTYSDLSVKLNYTDTTSPYSSGVSAGLFVYPTAGAVDISEIFDKTQIWIP